MVTPLSSPAGEEPDPTAWENVTPLPLRFGQHTDRFGNRWGFTQEGKLGLSGQPSSPTPASGRPGTLSIGNDAFTPQSARQTPDGSEVEITGTCGAYSVTRRIWVDRTRGGARFIDTISSTREANENVVVSLELLDVSQAPFRLDGSAVPSQTPGAELRGEETISFHPPAGNEETNSCLWLLGENKEGPIPRWLPAVTERPPQLQWKLTLPAKGQVSLVYWVIQRSNVSPGQSGEVLKAFWKNGRLVQSQVPSTLAATVVNFTPKQLQMDTEPAATDWLASLTRFTSALGIERGTEDVYWMNTNSHLKGEVSGKPLVVESRLGRLEVPLADVAAVQGAGGGGRIPRVFLRDGLVLPGALTLPEWKITGARGWTIQLQPETLEAVVLRAQPEDGLTANKATVLARLTSGEVLPLNWRGGETLTLATPWGSLEVPLSAIRAFWHVRTPVPACRLCLADGSQVTVFPLPREVEGQNPRLGPVRFALTDLDALWQPGYEIPAPDEEPEEITGLDELQAASGCLLKGQNLIAATLADEKLMFTSGAAHTQVPAAEILELRRVEPASDTLPVFVISLAGGASFQGTLSGESITLRTHTSTWQVPLSHLLIYKRLDTAATPQ